MEGLDKRIGWLYSTTVAFIQYFQTVLVDQVGDWSYKGFGLKRYSLKMKSAPDQKGHVSNAICIL